MRQSHLRPLALTWLTFSEEALAELAAAWRSADAVPFRGAWEPAYLRRWLRDWLRARITAPICRLLAAARRYAALLLVCLATLLRRAFIRAASAPLRWLRAAASRAAVIAGAALLRCPRRAAVACGRFGIGLQRVVRHAVAVGLLPPAASRHLLAARLAVRRRAASIAAYYSNVLVAIIPGMHYFFMP